MAQPKSKSNNYGWEATFPVKLNSLYDSMQFMRRILYVGFSQIVCARGLLPLESFKKRRFENLRLWMFNPEDPDALETSDYIRGALEAMEMGYLREFHLLIHDDAKGTVVEVYKMVVKYANDESSIIFTSSGDEMEIKYEGEATVRDRTKELLIRIRMAIAGLRVLPDSTSFDFYIVYNDETTPKGFQARGFIRKPVPDKQSPNMQGITLGETHTKFHGSRFDIQSVYIADAVEFEERISGDFADIENTFLELSTDSTFDGLSPPRSSSARSASKEHLPPQPAKPQKSRESTGESLAKKAGNMHINENVTASSPEEREVLLKTIKRQLTRSPEKRGGRKGRSPLKVSEASKVITKTPGSAPGKIRGGSSGRNR